MDKNELHPKQRHIARQPWDEHEGQEVKKRDYAELSYMQAM